MSTRRYEQLVTSTLAESRDPRPGTIPAPVPTALLGHRYAAGPPAAGDDGARPAAEVDDLLRRRRSVRSFSPQAPVPAATIGRVIAAAAAAEADLYPGEAEAGIDVELTLVAWRVAPLEPGVYAWDGEGFRWIKDAPERSRPGTVALQRELQAAPLLLLAAGNLLAACARHGGRGYPMLLTRAGVLCHSAWLSALEQGLYGAIFAGFQAVAAREIFGPSMVRRQLLALALGFPGEDEP